jgi:hypothetical protein
MCHFRPAGRGAFLFGGRRLASQPERRPRHARGDRPAGAAVPLEGDPVRHTTKTSKTQAWFREAVQSGMRLFRAPRALVVRSRLGSPVGPFI